MLLLFLLTPLWGQAQKDNFYSKDTIYATWIMIWNGSTESWWIPDNSNGYKVLVNGVWQAINWNDQTHILTYFNAIKEAGIDVIIDDLTNGLGWTWQSKYVQQLCLENGMKFAVAFNPNAGIDMETGCQTIWREYASPEAVNAGSYLFKDDKPLVILYTTRTGYQQSIAITGGYRSKFSTVWASGEDSEKDKWGWQLVPRVGPVASSDSMFVTNSVKYSVQKWRRNPAWLDYGFAVARQHKPKFLVVGSFDDVSERNHWMVADTSGADVSRQNRDTSGALSTDSTYNRVRNWVLDGRPASIAGGAISDGAYRVVASDGRLLVVYQSQNVGSQAILSSTSTKPANLIWFYHLGNHEYRMIKLSAGFPLKASNSTVVTDWDSEDDTQRWILQKEGDKFVILQKATGEALDWEADNVVTRLRNSASDSQLWSFETEVTLPTADQSSYPTWSNGANFDHDSNIDGVANGLAWIFGASQPNSLANHMLPIIDSVSDPDGKLLFVYRRIRSVVGDPDLELKVEYGSNLNSWTPAVHQGSNPDQITIKEKTNGYGWGVDQVTCAIPSNIWRSSRFFVRLAATASGF